MIIGIIHKGSGLGDQVFSYIATRVRAADLDVDFGFVGKEFFKGASFMNLDWGKETDLKYDIHPASGALVFYENVPNVYKLDKPYYDPEFNFIPDGSVINGYGAQDIRYFEHRLDEVREWLKVEPLKIDEDQCILNIRGGEYKAVSELFLPKEYFIDGVSFLENKLNQHLYLKVHTDDIELGQLWFSGLNITRNIEENWKALRYAKNAIISNSAFAIIPRLLAHLDNSNAVTIAPKYWAGRNVGEWRRPNNYYRQFQYI